MNYKANNQFQDFVFIYSCTAGFSLRFDQKSCITGTTQPLKRVLIISSLPLRQRWNKGRNGTNHGLFRQFKSVKTVADCQDSCRLSRQLQTFKTVAFGQSVIAASEDY